MASTESRLRNAILALPTLGPNPVTGAEVEVFRGAVHSLARRFYPSLQRFHTYDDIHAIGMAVAWASLSRWREDGGASKLTFVCRMVKFAYISESRYWRLKCRRAARYASDIDEQHDSAPRFQVASDEADPEAALSDAETARSCGSLEDSMRRLDARELVVVRRVSTDASLRAIGKELGISHEMVRQIRDRALTKLRRAIEQAELMPERKPERLLSGAL